MSENVRETEKTNTGEPEKIDILNAAAAFWNGFRKLWPVMLVIVIVCTFRSYFSTSFSYTPQYVASATVSVTTVGGSYNNIEAAQKMAAVFPYILTSGVLEDVVMNDMGLDYLPGKISVEAEEDMNLLTISVSSDDPQMAYDTLTSVIKNYPEVAEYIFGDTNLKILDETGIPSDTRKEIVIRGSYRKGAVQGLIVSGIILCLYVFMKRTVRTKEKLNRQINLHDLGSLPNVRMKKRKDRTFNELSLLNERIAPAYEEAVRRLRIRVMTECENRGGNVIMVTSSVPGEGKTTIAVNLAVAIARQGKTVILADCDTRNPLVAGIMHNTGKHPGIGAVLKGKVQLRYALSDPKISGTEMRVLFGGRPNTEDASLLGSAKMKAAVEEMRQQADYVILDTAPAELLADASQLAKYADSVLYVIRCDYTKMKNIRDGIESLASRDVDIMGYVFNGDVNQKLNRYGYGYGYGYGKYGSYGRYGRYSRYGKRYRDTGKLQDDSGRVIKE